MHHPHFLRKHQFLPLSSWHRPARLGLVLLFGIVLLLLLVLASRPGAAQECTPGRDCCVVGQSMGQPRQYAVACDGQAQSASGAAAAGGYPIVVFGPTTWQRAAAWMANANVPGWDRWRQAAPGLPPPPPMDTSCTLGTNCCFVGATWEQPPRYALAHDGQAQRGDHALHAQGYHSIVHGPVSAAACYAWWNQNVAARGLGAPMGLAGGQAQPPSTAGGGPSGPAGPRGGSPRWPGPPQTGISITLSPQAWVRAAQFVGPVTAAAQGLAIGGGPWTNGQLRNNAYDGNKVTSRDSIDLSAGGDVYMAFMADGAGKYMAFYPRLLTGVGVKYMTTHHSWSGSVVAPDRTWLFGHLRVEPDGSYRLTVARSDYDDRGGQVIHSSTGRLGSMRGNLEMHFVDNYAGVKASMLIGEAWVYAGGAQTPRPGASAGASGGHGAPCSSNAQCASGICLLGVCARPIP